ncbi:hypothetical protein MBLNU459_g1491t1 [Dothideomycetes sp. NU459]
MSVSVPRQPFAIVDSPRLAHLNSSKNRQNGAAVPSPLSPKSLKFTTTSPIFNASAKRRFSPSLALDSPAFGYEDAGSEDAENQAPDSLLSPTKRTKTNDSTPSKPAFTLSTSTPTFSFTSPKPGPAAVVASAVPGRLQHTPIRANSSSPRAPLTAPAGRSPPRKVAPASALLRAKRRVSAPFTRIDPPSFVRSATAAAAAAAGSGGLPFSLDAALTSTLLAASTVAAPVSSVSPKALESVAATMPRTWFFDIHEDSPEEEAAVLMEHSTLTLDLSSDDEAAVRKRQAEGRGKENVAPVDYSAVSPVAVAAAVAAAAAAAATPTTTTTTAAARQTRHAAPSAHDHNLRPRRRRAVKENDMHDGERSPLSDLETEDFFAEGLGKESVVYVSAGEPAAPTASGAEKIKKSSALSVVSSRPEAEAEIFVFEDDDVAASGDVGGVVAGEKRKRSADGIVG